MIWRQPAPKAIEHFRNAGGALDYSFFLVDEENRIAHLKAIDAHLTDADISFEDPDKWNLPEDQSAYLKQLVSHELTQDQFFGDWCDSKDRMLIKCGVGEVKGQGRVSDPRYDTIYDRRFGMWGSGAPGLGEVGHYAYAFSQPPYKLSLSLRETQMCFQDINQLIIPEGVETNVYDWSEQDLTLLNAYFEAGAEWWGTFLFTLHQPSRSTLIVISGSSTD